MRHRSAIPTALAATDIRVPLGRPSARSHKFVLQKTNHNYDLEHTSPISELSPSSGIARPGSSPLKQPDIYIPFTGSVATKTTIDDSKVQSQEIRRRRGRESHNAVEHRRRNNINERIQDLSRLVPANRFQDEKIRKQAIVSTVQSLKDHAWSSNTLLNSDEELYSGQDQGTYFRETNAPYSIGQLSLAALTSHDAEPCDRPTPRSLGWATKHAIIDRYHMVLNRDGAPYLELLAGFEPSPETPSKVYLDPPK